ncbi:MAG: hypothetical protein J0H98_03720 [Solirubrobacterales bacterium]|nr:hypothetical protein [Solirubrobacterales bacterium]
MSALQLRTRVGWAALFAGLAAVAACLALGAASARADDGSLSVSLDTGVINLGSTTGVKVIDPGNVPPDPPAKLNATLTDAGAVSTPPSGFIFPTKVIEDLQAGPLTVDATIEISATGTITGTFDRDTGAASFSIPTQARISVSTAGSTGEPLGICKVSGFTFGLSTTGTLEDPGVPDADPPHPAHDYDAAPFDPDGGWQGAAVAEWPSGLPASVPDGGTAPDLVCPQVDGLIGGPGGIWLSGTATPSAGPVQLPPTAQPAITAGPDNPTTSTDATFEFGQGAGETEPVTGFQCRLDSSSSADWQACGSGTSGSASYTGLAAGQHEFEVRAVNDVGPGPVTDQSWAIESSLAPPSAAPKITSGPPAETTETTAAFAFEKGSGESQPVDGFECRLDSGAWSACDSGSVSYTGLTVGDHGFEVRAENAAGDGPVASAAWKVGAPTPTCAEDPGQPGCLGRIASVKLTPRVKKVKRGRTAVFKVAVKNGGDGIARRVKLCVKAPKQLKTVGAKCRTIARLAPGKTARIVLKVKATRKARVGRAYRVTVKATGPGLKAKSGNATVRIRR